MRRLIAALVLGLAFAGISACATTGEAGEGAIAIEVQHDVPLAGPMTVSIQAENGPRRVLGTVAPDQTRRFDFRPAQGAGYVLMAEAQGARDIRSNVFFIPAGTQTVTWDLADNQVGTD